jgi:hypothetical protein
MKDLTAASLLGRVMAMAWRDFPNRHGESNHDPERFGPYRGAVAGSSLAQRSRQFLNGAVAAAQIALANETPFAVDWTLADDSTVELDAAGVIAAGLAIAGHVGTIHQRARVLKARIDAAETLAAIAAVTWTLED